MTQLINQQMSQLIAGYMRNNYVNEFNATDRYPSSLNGVILEILGNIICQIGDRVELQCGKRVMVTGIIRFIGKPNFSPKEILGIELDNWSPNASEGKTLFKTAPGTAYFTTYTHGIVISYSGIKQGSYARLKGLLRVPKFNGKMIKIIAYVKEKGRYKVRLLVAKTEKKFLGVREENLEPFSVNCFVIDKEYIDGRSLNITPEIGDKVESRNKIVGIVKYVGLLHFDSSRSAIYIGLELEKYDLNGNDGTINDKQYFVAKDGFGYFVGIWDLVKNYSLMTRIDLAQKELTKKVALLVSGYMRDKFGNTCFEDRYHISVIDVISKMVGFALSDVPKLGDCVVTIQGEFGIVRYIGLTSFGEGIYFGLEMEQCVANGNDGSIGNKRYFQCLKDHGYFGTISNFVANLGRKQFRRYACYLCHQPYSTTQILQQN